MVKREGEEEEEGRGGGEVEDGERRMMGGGDWEGGRGVMVLCIFHIIPLVISEYM